MTDPTAHRADIRDSAPKPRSGGGGFAQRLRDRARRLSQSARFVMGASGVCFIFVVNGLIGYGVWRQHGDAQEGARREANAAVGALAELTQATLRQTAQLLEEMATLQRLQRRAPAAGIDLAAVFRRRVDAASYIANIMLLRTDGEVALRARELSIGDSLGLAGAERAGAAFAAPGLDERVAASLFIAPPLTMAHRRTPTALPVVLRLETDDGDYDGMLVALIDLERLGHAFKEHASAYGVIGALFGKNGQTLLSQPEERAPPTTTGQLCSSPAASGAAIDPPSGDYQVGCRRLKDYDATVGAMRSLDAALTTWRRDAAAWGGIGFAMTCAIALLTFYAVNRHERIEKSRSELLEASARIRGILESMVDAVVTIDGRGRILTFNRAAERLFNYTEEEAVGQSINILVPQQHHQHHHNIDPGATFSGGRSRILGTDREILGMRKDGATFPITLAVSALAGVPPNAPPERRVFVGVVRDITQRKRHETELSAAKIAAEAANQAKSVFLANMSHELRTPLNAVIGFSELLGSEFFGVMNDKQKACAQDIHTSGSHLLEIVNAVLDMSKIESGRYELIEEDIDAAALLTQCLQMTQARAMETGVILTDRIGAPPKLRADRRAFRQIVLNLLSNAVKFSPPGKPVILETAMSPCGLEIRVADAGDGVPEDFKPYLFQPFRQADAEASRRFDGVGLGLAIAQNLITQHGGTLRCHSRPGEGATFAAIFPAERLIAAPNNAAPNNSVGNKADFEEPVSAP